MARITLRQLRHSYQARPQQPEDWALKQLDLEWHDGGAYALLGPSRLRQDHLAQHHLRPGAADRRPGAVRRRRPDRRADRAAAHRAGVPVSGRLRHHDGLRQSGVPVAQPRPARARDRREGERDRPHARPAGYARQARLRPDGGRQAEDLARPRAGALRRQCHHVRRAADGDRSAPEVAAALEAEGTAPAHRAHDDLRHARPDRGPDLRRQRRGHARGHGGADRLADRAVRAAAPYLRRPFHRLAGNERAALRGRCAGRDHRRACGRGAEPAGCAERQTPRGRRAAGIREFRPRGPAGRDREGRRCRTPPHRRGAPRCEPHQRAGGRRRRAAVGRRTAAVRSGLYENFYADGWLVE